MKILENLTKENPLKEKPKEEVLDEDFDTTTISLSQYQQEVEFVDTEYLAYGCRRVKPKFVDD